MLRDMPMLHQGWNLCIDSFGRWRAAAYTDLPSETVYVEMGEEPLSELD